MLIIGFIGFIGFIIIGFIHINIFATETRHILADTPLLGLFIGPNEVNKDTPLLNIYK
jgi:hypothetical protein